MSAEEIKRHLTKRFSDSSFDVHHLANELGLSESYLREVIGMHYGFCPRHLIETIRMEEAIRLLAGENTSLFQICAKVGFASAKSFSRAFKKRTGMQPGEFKKAIRESNNASTELAKMTALLWGYSSPV